MHSSSGKSEDWCCIVGVQTHNPAKLELAVFIYSQHVLAAIRFIFFCTIGPLLADLYNMLAVSGRISLDYGNVI